jgi:hypothetical protein
MNSAPRDSSQRTRTPWFNRATAFPYNRATFAITAPLPWSDCREQTERRERKKKAAAGEPSLALEFQPRWVVDDARLSPGKLIVESVWRKLVPSCGDCSPKTNVRHRTKLFRGRVSLLQNRRWSTSYWRNAFIAWDRDLVSVTWSVPVDALGSTTRSNSRNCAPSPILRHRSTKWRGWAALLRNPWYGSPLPFRFAFNSALH